MMLSLLIESDEDSVISHIREKVLFSEVAGLIDRCVSMMSHVWVGLAS